MSSARSVARELLRLSQGEPVPDPLTYYRLQCLLYYAQAWSLALRDSELFPEEIECQEDGPAVQTVQPVGDAPACRVVRPDSFIDEPTLDAEDEGLFLRHLWDAYRSLSPSGLRTLMEDEAPFLKWRKEGNRLLAMNDLAESFRRRPALPVPLEDYRRARKDQEKEAELSILRSPPLDAEAIWKGCRSVTPSATPR